MLTPLVLQPSPSKTMATSKNSCVWLKTAMAKRGASRVLLSSNAQLRARLWPDPHGPIDVDTVRVVGRRLKFNGSLLRVQELDAFVHQALAFGPEMNLRLRSMRI